jgi:hypothetical protein
MTTGKYCCSGATALKKSVPQSVVPFAKHIAKADAVLELVESPMWPRVQGEKSDPPVGTGRGLKPCAQKPQSKAVRKIRAAFFLLWSMLRTMLRTMFCHDFLALHFFRHIPSCQSEAERLQNEHAGRCFCGVGDEPNCLMENLI